ALMADSSGPLDPLRMVYESEPREEPPMRTGDRDEFNRAVSAAREFDPFRAEFLEHEFETYDLLRDHLPIARSESMGNEVMGGHRAGWVLTRYADAAEVLRNTGDFSSQTMRYPVRPWI